MTMFCLIFVSNNTYRKAWKLYSSLNTSVINHTSESDFLYTLSFIFSFFVIQKWTIVGNGTTTARRKENQHTVVICKSLFSYGAC